MTRWLAGLVLLVALSACGSDGGVSVTAADLDGTWVNVDSGTVRAFEFHAAGAAYTLYFYPSGQPPAANQSGTYSIAAGRLVTQVAQSTDTTIVGMSFGNDILGFDASTLTIETTSTASGQRVFSRATALP